MRRGVRPVTRPRAWHALLLLPLAGIAVWLVVRGRAVRDDPAAVLAALRATAGPTLPDAGAAGATGRSEPSSYDRDTLYEYIDGAAEAYLSRGFERCVVATYTVAPAGTEALDITAEVYRFSAVGGATGQMDAERPAAAQPVGGVPGALSDSTTLLSVRGCDYLKLTSLGSGRDAGKALAGLAAAWHRVQP